MFSGDLRHFFPPFLFPYSNSFSPACELFNPILRLVRMVLVYVRITLFEWCVTVKGMVFRIGLLATRLPLSDCFRGASIGFASHKTADGAGKSRTIRRANWRYEPRQVRKGSRREVKLDGKKPKSRIVCHFHAQKVVREQRITGIFDYFCALK